MQSEQDMLRKVKLLLAKAESTTFPAEAEALMQKAQQYITQYKIDLRLLTPGEDGDTTVQCKTFSMAKWSYAKAKFGLLAYIGQANDVFVVRTLRGKVIYLYGSPLALRNTIRLFASLRKQLNAQLETTVVPEDTHGRAFRTSFINGFAYTIGERLKAGKESAIRESPGSEMVLAREYDKAVDTAKDEHGGIRRTQNSRTTSSQGFGAGREAGERARLATQRIGA